MHKASLIRSKAVPLHKQVESGYYKGEPRSHIRPHPVPYLLEVAHSGEHGEYVLDDHAIIPGVRLAHLHVGRVSSFSRSGVEASVSQHYHLLLKVCHHISEDVVIVISRVATPPNSQAPLVDHQTELHTYNPPPVALTFTSDLVGRATFSDGVDQLDTIGVACSKYSRLSQETSSPLSMSSGAAAANKRKRRVRSGR